MKALIKEQEWL